MLKGYRCIDKYLTDWCKSNGFNVKCRLNTDFSYEQDTNTIYYTLVIPYSHDELFAEICSNYLPDIKKCDNFILSFFHELGHYKTQSNFYDDEMCDYYDFVSKLKKKEKCTKRDYRKYYLHPVELSATEWGCNYINSHTDKIQDFFNELKPLILDFYKKNKLELN